MCVVSLSPLYPVVRTDCTATHSAPLCKAVHMCSAPSHGSSASQDHKKQPTVDTDKPVLRVTVQEWQHWRLPTQELVNSSRDKQTMVHRTAVPEDQSPGAD